MRDIKFRGKTKTCDGEMWVYGGYVKQKSFFNDNTATFIIKNTELHFLVDEKTIGQYTGLKDKNSKEIYEGDIVKSFFVDKDEDGNEIYKYHVIKIEYDEILCSYKIDSFMNLEVIGNIHDNPELLGDD